MAKKTTEELRNVLKSTSVDHIQDYLAKNRESLVSDEGSFANYMRMKMREKGLKQQDVFLEADIPERYGYKLISQEKHTQQRDTILRICYAAHFSLEEVQHALKLYQMPELYPKIPRDALLMIVFNERPGTITDVNSYLLKNGMDSLWESGGQI